MMKNKRVGKSREVSIGAVRIGGNRPIAIQSMTNTDTRDVEATVAQIVRLEEAGCEIVRVAVVDSEAAAKLPEIKRRIGIPLVADIHFDHRLALQAIAAGVDKLRINPGNIGSTTKVREVVQAALDRQIPIRIGVNSGSLPKHILDKHGLTVTAMVESALEHVAILEKLSFFDIVISLKATDVRLTQEAYRLLREKVDYPLHLGITEAGTAWYGTIKSAVGLGALLLDGIGDTLRVSLTADPVEEVKVGWAILSSVGLRQRGPVFISCPTCGRTRIPVETIANEVEEQLRNFPRPLKIAIMGCAVNGPGEAREADYGIAGGAGVGLIFRKGEIIKKVPQEDLVSTLIEEIRRSEN